MRYQARQASPHGERIGGEHARASERADSKHFARLVDQQYLDVGRTADPDRLAENPVEDLPQVQAARHGLQRGQERFQLRAPADGGLVQPGVLDGDGGLGGEQSEDLPVLLRERLLVRFALDAEHAHQAVAEEQGLGQHGSVSGAFREEGDRVRRGPEIVDDHSLPPLRRRSRHPLAEVEPAVVPVRAASRIGPGDEPLARLIPKPDHAVAATDHLYHTLCDEVKQSTEIQLARDLDADGADRFELFAPADGGLVQPGVLDGDGRLGGKGGQVGHFVRTVLPRRG